MELRGKNVTVVGCARSGLSASLLLHERGARVSVTDNSDTEEVKDNVEELKRRDIKVEIGKHSQGFIEGADLLVLSPGVRDDSLPVVWAERERIPIISELELASSFCKAPTVAITGTNGKTTVTTLVAEVLKLTGKRVFCLGNIGSPLSREVLQLNENDLVCVEVSSFQLERIVNFKPKVAAFLNFSPDHLDRYKDMYSYLGAKKRIFMNQDEDDFAVLNFDDPVVRNVAKEMRAKVLYFSKDKSFNLNRSSNFPNCNHSAVITIGSIFGLEQKAMLKALSQFSGIEHRFEQVGIIEGIRFINDSKATNLEATRWALSSCGEPVVLIAGGRDKGSDFSAIADLIKKKVKFIILIGEARNRIARELSGITPIVESGSLEEAVPLAFKKAKKGDCVLLSPMCASLDMFKNFEERGRVFKEAVRRLNQ